MIMQLALKGLKKCVFIDTHTDANHKANRAKTEQRVRVLRYSLYYCCNLVGLK